jgi:hypothetical protein
MESLRNETNDPRSGCCNDFGPSASSRKRHAQHSGSRSSGRPTGRQAASAQARGRISVWPRCGAEELHGDNSRDEQIAERAELRAERTRRKHESILRRSCRDPMRMEQPLQHRSSDTRRSRCPWSQCGELVARLGCPPEALGHRPDGQMSIREACTPRRSTLTIRRAKPIDVKPFPRPA